jgi:serine protease Do
LDNQQSAISIQHLQKFTIGGSLMNPWKGAALVAVLVAAAGIGAAYLPPAHAQTARPAKTLEVFGGRGSQIGVSIREVEDTDAKDSKLSAPSGVVIEEVSEESPAAKAGLKKGDIVVEFDGERVRSVRQFTRLVQETPAGRKTQAAVMRGGQRVSVTIEPRDGNAFMFDDGNLSVLKDFSHDFAFAIPRPPTPPAAPVTPKPPVAPAFPDFDTFTWRSNNGLGIAVGDLSQQLAEYFGTKDGVLVTSVTDNSAAAKAGIKAGDVITTFNGSAVTSPSDLRQRIRALQDGDEFTVAVMRDKKPMTLKGKAETTRPRRTSRAIV